VSGLKINAILFDLDGTLYLGENLIPNADLAVNQLREAGFSVAFLTNKPTASPRSYATKLTGLGIHADGSDVITSVRLTCDYLETNHPDARIFVVGESYLSDTLGERGFIAATLPEQTDVVILSLDRHFDYGKLDYAFKAVKSGARVIATNPDAICPMADGDIIDAGAWIAALEVLIKRPIDAVLGKPSSRCAQLALSVLGCQPEEVLMVGDRMETDMRMAREAGMKAALVLSGVTTQSEADLADPRPDFVLQSVADLPTVLGLT
jgi:HAD superfamily hydrolase (TIGR01450 family)